jgi:hypothetical protein
MCAPTIVADHAHARGIDHCRQPQRRRSNRYSMTSVMLVSNR